MHGLIRQWFTYASLLPGSAGMRFASWMGMLIAITIWEERVSPVFDVAQRLVLVHVEEGKVLQISELALPSGQARTKWLADRRVDVLLCGAITGCVRRELEESGMRVFPNVCGPFQQVLEAYLENRLAQRGMLMPGCGGRSAGTEGSSGSGNGQRGPRGCGCRHPRPSGKTS